eukprot:2545232-Ditylum_brightwellii.AAC.1
MSSGDVNFGDEVNLKRSFCVGVGVFCTICINGLVLLSTYFDRAAHLQLYVSSTPVRLLPPCSD